MARSVDVLIENHATEKESEVFFSLQCFICEYNPKPAGFRGKESETGKEGKPYKVKAIPAGRSVLGNA